MIKYIIFILFTIFTMNAYSSSNPQFEVGTIPSSSCNVDGDSYYCEYTFNKKFKEIPLVFLMPTITPNDKNAPSSLHIKKITRFKIFFSQEVAPKTKLNLVDMIKMTNINYIATEPGLIDLNGDGTIYAGTVNINKIQIYSKSLSVCKKKPESKECTYAKKLVEIKKYIGWHEIELPYKFREKPSIITQVQSNNNNIWMTTVTNDIDNDEFDLALELSEVIPTEKIIKSENVAYLLGSGSGSYNGLRFLFKTISTKNTLNRNKTPIVSACNMLTPFGETINNPIILGGKESRKGPNGGWLRLCEFTNQAVSFVVDEDTAFDNERDHHDEEVGLFVFGKDKKPLPDDICSIFPSPVQTWENASKGNISISNSGRIVNSKMIDNKHVIGFLNHNIQDDNNKGCDGERCYSNQTLILSKDVILPKYNNSSSIVDYDSKWSGPIGNKKEFNRIIVNADAPLSLLSGTKANELYVENGAILNLSSGDYWFKKIIVTGGTINIRQSNAKIYTYSMSVSSGYNWRRHEQSNIGGENKLFVYVYKNKKDPFNYLMLSQSSKLYGFVYSQSEVNLSNNAIIYGNVTSNSILMTNHAKIIGSNQCDTPTVKYHLAITPASASIGFCRPQNIVFSVLNSSGDLVNDFNGEIKLLTSVNNFNQAYWLSSINNKKDDANRENLFPIKNGKLSLYLKSNIDTEIFVAASLVNYDSSVNGKYTFTESNFKIEPSNVNLIAGKDKKITIKAYGCNDENNSSIYTGDKNISLISKYIQPQTKGNSIISVQDIHNNWQTKNAILNFNKNGEAQTSIKYSDAGIVNLDIQDALLKGSVKVKSRPWTFAICPLTFNGKNKYDNASGTSNGGEAYTAAGKPFDIVAKPLIWQIGDPDSESAMVDVSEQIYCNRPVTQNFFEKDAPSLNTGVTLSNGGLDSPNNGQKGVFSSQPQTDNSQQEFNGLLIADNSWSEVGSLWVNANLTNYLGMTVNSSKRHIGRFFPAYFGLTHNQLTPAMTSFTYMGQPFPVHWTVNAFNQQGKALDNYDQFAETLTAKFGFVVKNNNGGDDQRLLLQDPVPEKWSHNTENSHSYINYQSNVTYARKGFLSTPLITSPDGPDELWQLWLNLLNPSDNRPIDSPRLLTSELCSSKDGCTNPTVQKVISLRIGNQNPMRYGRMALQDAAGDIGKSLTIPLRVEYWNGAEFVTNSDDSASTFDGANYCRQILIQEPVPHTPNNTTTSGAGTVNLGQPLLSQLMANPDGDFKQQIRFWQRLSAFTKPTKIVKTPKIYCKDSASNQPWLSYNWRGIGDEDPSATVTFGVYHGNNRIIYRGETNNAGQSIPYLNYQ
ncbi:DUF6701 domain-containing protein [Photobacterium carnosum]|uniref:DUF6701 domain-containing protein n=1 Tax=Photobacterium carnosum TaxID=2023717 RepID=UPI001E58DF8B|nr:DUF6701 domain-containing protein [Photobacterium carnosum]MCD9499560.1 hypothetical protein [Photobacterium carnosum]